MSSLLHAPAALFSVKATMTMFVVVAKRKVFAENQTPVVQIIISNV
jgi:hypothetical protein